MSLLIRRISKSLLSHDVHRDVVSEQQTKPLVVVYASTLRETDNVIPSETLAQKQADKEQNVLPGQYYLCC